MAEVVVTQFQLDISQYEANLAKATKGMEGFDKSTDAAETGTKGLGNELGSASQKLVVLEKSTKVAGKGLAEVKKETGGLKEAFNAVGQELNSTFPIFGKIGNAAKLLGRAFTAALGPVGIAIAAVVAAIGLLTKVFFGTERGSETLDRALSILTTVLDRLLGVAQKVTFALVETFKNPQQAVKDLLAIIQENLSNRLTGLIDQFRALGDVIAGVFTLDTDRITAGVNNFGESTVQVLTGVDDLAGKVAAGFNKLGAEISDAAKDGLQIEKLKEQLEDLALVQAKREGELNRVIAEQLDIARDVNKTNEERKAAAQAAISAQNELSGLSAKQNSLEVQRLALQQKQSDTSIEGQIELAKLKAQGDQIEADRISANRRAQAISRGIDAQSAAEQQERIKQLAEAEAERQQQRIETQQEVDARLDELRQERELAGLSETDRAIAEARLRAQKEIEVAGALFDSLEKLAADDAQALIDIRAQQAENIALIEQGLVEKITAIRTEADEKDEEKRKADSERLKAEEAERLAVVQEAATQAQDIVVGLADGSIKSAEDASKALIGIALDAAEKQALIAVTNATTGSIASAQSVATGGAAGIAQAAILAALIRGAFALLKSQLAGAYTGERVVGDRGGPRIWNGRDGYLRRVHEGEGIIDASTNRKYLPYLDMMRDGQFEKFLNTTAQLNSYGTRATSSTAAPGFNDRRIVGALSGVSNAREQRKQTELLALVASGLRRGTNARYTA
jgi:hypothetical protein